MPINFTCPQCGYTSRIDEQFIGRTGPCSNCGKSITVVAPPTTTAPPKSSSKPVLLILGIVGGIIVMFGVLVTLLVLMLYPALRTARAAADRAGCTRQTSQICMALNAYHDQFGSYPPAYVTDSAGKPMHSWRVLILPQLGRQSLYDSYNFEEPWDSPGNLEVAKRMPEVYACPADRQAGDLNDTSYMVIVGPGTAFPGAATTSRDAIRDNHGDTLLVVEVASSGIGWTQPIDLPANQISWELNGPPSNSIGSQHGDNEAVVGFVDGHVETLTETATPQTLHDMSTISGGEPVPRRQ